MKDEEMAEEYCNHLQSEMLAYTPENPRQQRTVTLLDVEEAFLAGLKAGRPQWHDLEKDHTDLPDNGILVLCIDKVWTGQTFTTILRCCDGVFIDDNETPYDVIAWCEIPTFDKE